MKKMLKGVSILMALALLTVTLLTGCGSNNKEPVKDGASETQNTDQKDTVKEEKSEALKEAKLKMYLLGDKAQDFDQVYGEVNKLLQQDINATVEVSFMSWSDYQQKYPLVFASGEDFDLIYTANWCFYNAQAVKGGFKEITKDMVEKYAPKTAESMYDEAWDQAKVNGKVYMLPMNYKELNPFVFMVRGDLMEKNNISDIKSIDDFGKYLDAVSQNEKQLIPCDIGSDQDFDALFWSYGQGLIKNQMDGFGARQTLMAYDASDKSTAKLF